MKNCDSMPDQENAMKKEVSWKHVKALSLLCLIFLYSLSIMLIDYGASLKSYNECGECYKALGIDKPTHFVLQSLVFKNIEPRVAYHAGLVLSLCIILVLSFLYIYEAF